MSNVNVQLAHCVIVFVLLNMDVGFPLGLCMEFNWIFFRIYCTHWRVLSSANGTSL